MALVVLLLLLKAGVWTQERITVPTPLVALVVLLLLLKAGVWTQERITVPTPLVALVVLLLLLKAGVSYSTSGTRGVTIVTKSRGVN